MARGAQDITEFEDVILAGMARALWSHAFMIWSTEVEPAPMMGGETWADVTPDSPEIREASMKAARALAEVLTTRNHLGARPMAELFITSVQARRGRPPGRPSHATPGTRGGATEADVAYAFGEDLAHVAMGTREPGDAAVALPANIVVPHFAVELNDHGDEITWDGGMSWNPHARANSGALEILLIEDDPALQRSTTRMIKKLYPTATVLLADNYDAAVGNLKNHPIKLVISDVNILGAESGVDVFRWVQQHQPDLVDKYVFFTGGNPQVEQIHYRFLEKPAGVADLKAAIWKAAPGAAPARTRADTVRPTVHLAPPAAAARDFAPRFLAAFAQIDRGNNYVLLYDLRRALPDVPRHVFDAGVNDLRRAKVVSLDSADGRHLRLTPEQRDAGIHEAGSVLVYAQLREPPAVPRYAPVVDGAAVARMVHEAMPRIRETHGRSGLATGRYGNDNVFIAALWRALAADPRMRGVTSAQFQRLLVQANRDRLLVLARADMVDDMDPDEVAESEINDLGAQFHFVLDDRRRTAAPAVDTATVARLVREVSPRIRQEGSESDRSRGRFGDKVFIAALWRLLASDPRMQGITMAQFKRLLIDANRQGHLVLARADLVGAMDRDEIRESEISDLGSEFHFVLDRGA